jgi:transposase
MTHATTVPSQMTIGLDVGDRTTHFHVVDAKRASLAAGSCRTRRGELSSALAKFVGARVALEAGSQSPWLSRFLRSEGFTVHVADPRRVQLISKDPRKTDRRDARMLALLEVGNPELLGDVHHRGEQAQADLSVVRARDLLVRMRTMAVLQVRSLAKAFGTRLSASSAEAFPKKILAHVPEVLLPAVEPVLDLVLDLTRRIKQFDRLLAQIAKSRYPEVAHLRTVHSVGPVTATAFVLSIEDPKRFKSNREVGSWLGLCPRSHASGDSNPQLPISKAGNNYLRRLLVQVAHHLLGPFGKDSDLRRFGLSLIARGGRSPRKRAAAAVARKMAVRLLMLWRTGKTYDPLHNANRHPTAAAPAMAAAV